MFFGLLTTLYRRAEARDAPGERNLAYIDDEYCGRPEELRSCKNIAMFEFPPVLLMRSNPKCNQSAV